MTPPRAVVCAVVSVHVAGVVGNSLFPVHLGKSTDLSWWEWPNLVPLVGYEARDMLEKVVVLVPLGVLLPLVARVTSLPRVLVCGFLISLTIELLQWVNDVTVHGGHIPDINDLLFNTAGTPIGYGLFRIALLVPVLHRLARSATWPPPRPDQADAAPASQEPSTRG